MLPLIRIFLLWVSVTISSHLALSHFWQGIVAERTLRSGTEPNSIKFLGLLMVFGISTYYLWREMGAWKTDMLWKTIITAVLFIGFLVGISSLERLDQKAYNDQAEYQLRLVAFSLDTETGNVFRELTKRVTQDATPEQVRESLPGALVSDIVSREDSSGYQDFLYWMGPGTLPIGAHVSYSPPPHRVTGVEPLPRSRGPISPVDETSGPAGFRTQPEEGG